MDEWINFDCEEEPAYSGKINRTWTAYDASGNSTTCVQMIWLKRATHDDVQMPPDFDGIGTNPPPLSCEGNCFVEGVADPGCTGVPYIHDPYYPVNFHDGHSECEINVTFTDTRIDVCHGTYKILRDWRIVDWCTGEIWEHTQIIKVEDTQTEIICPDPYVVGTNLGQWTCGWQGNIKPATINDVCSGDWFTVTTKVFENVQAAYGLGFEWVLFDEINGNGGPLSPGVHLTYGEYKITYHIEDDCGNHDWCETFLTVVDDDPPVVVCDEFTQVTLDEFGEAIVYAETFDDGTHDNCCDMADLHFEVRRDGGDWGPHVAFTCVDCPGPVNVFMRATDCYGNTSEACMVQVFVDDKTPPVIVCPPDKTIECWSDHTDLSLTGEATATDACGVATITWSDVVNLNACGIGYIDRTFVATDVKGNSSSCTQRITTVDSTPLTVDFPPDYTANCTITGGGGFDGSTEPGDLPAPFNGPVIGGDDCELVAINHFDQFFPISDNACFKILREWIVIDWCIFDPNGPQTPDNGYYSQIQEIKVLDTAPPVFECIGTLDVCIDGPGCTTTVNIPVPVVDDCAPPDFITLQVLGDFDSFVTNDVGPGTYHVTIRAYDGCGNKTNCDVTITVVDCKPPTPYCRDAAVIDLMPSGMVDVWANDFDLGSFDNCPGDLSFTFADGSAVKTYTCDDFCNGPQIPVEMHVWDAAGNHDFCETVLVLQDNLGACTCGDPLIAGTIETEASFDNNPVEGVGVEINGSTDMGVVTTLSDGFFNLNVPVGGDYTVTPTHNEGPLNGVTTFDLVVMRKHILGTAYLDTPYKLIAADINNSHAITTLDMVELRKLILQINTDFPNNTSWRFVEGDYVFPDPTNPWTEEFPEIINVNNLTESMESADFVAVKIGDLNGNAQTSGLLGGAEDRSTGELVIKADDQELVAGQDYTVEFRSDDFNALGYQFTLNFDNQALEFEGIQAGVAGEENFGLTFLDEGSITTSWNGDATGDDLFGLTFKAKANANLSDLVSVSSRYTKAEAYNQNGEMLDVSLAFSNGKVANKEFELYQNTPNPFSSETVIGFNLKQEGNATLTVHDVSGKILRVVEGNYAEGYNEVRISSTNLPSTGVLYYTLKTADDTASRKMILMK